MSLEVEKINRVFHSVTLMFQSISFSLDPGGPCHLRQFRKTTKMGCLPPSKL